MTACTNNGGSRARRAVTAALVGVLSVGAAPMVALATQAEPANGEVAPLATIDDEGAINAGTIATFEDGLENGATFVVNGKAQGLVPDMVQPWPSSAKQVESDGFIIYKLSTAAAGGTLSTASGDADTASRTINGEAFYFDSSWEGDGKSSALPTQIGEYAVFAKVGSTPVFAGATFSIVAADLADAELYEVNSADTKDLTDEEFVFDNTAWKVDGSKLGIKIGDTALNMSDFTIAYYDAADKQVAAPTKAGNYTVVVTATSGNYANNKVKIPLVVNALDLSKASVVIPDAVAGNGVSQANLASVTVNGVTYAGTWVDTYTDVAFTGLPTGTGETTLTITPNNDKLKADGLEGSIVSSAVKTYSVVKASVPVSATYDGGSFSGTINVDFSADPTNEFDASKVKVSYTDPTSGKQVSTDKYYLRVTNTATKQVGGTEMLSQKGSYKVEVILDAKALDYQFTNSTVPSMTVNVTKGSINSADVAFTFKGDIKDNDFTVGEYVPGYDALDDIAVAVKTTTGKEVPASEYEVVVTNSDGDVVDSIEDADVYTITVKAEGYTFSGDHDVEVTVSPRDLSKLVGGIRAKGTLDYTDKAGNKHSILPYTGDVIEASYEWTCDGGKTYYDLPAADADVSYELNGKEAELKEAGVYTVELAADKDSKNYVGTGNAVTEVSKVKVFADVDSNAFYAQSIYDAADQGYIGGIGGTNLFAPMNSITRADVACVLYRMAGGSIESSKEDLTNEQIATISRFIDVDKNAYYARAVAWGVEMGIMNGYGDTFGSARNITTEEFVTMLARYAEKMGTDTAVDTDAVLASVSDGDEVSGYARDAVAWAVSEGYIAKGGNSIAPQENVARWRTVMIAVDFQPEQLDIIGNPDATKPSK